MSNKKLFSRLQFAHAEDKRYECPNGHEDGQHSGGVVHFVGVSGLGARWVAVLGAGGGPAIGGV